MQSTGALSRLMRAALLAGAALLGGAHLPSPALAQAPARAAPERPNVVIGILPTADYAPIVLAQREGYFAAEGLTVQLRTITAAIQIPGLLGGDLQASGVNWIGLLTAVNRGIDIRPLMEADRGAPGYTRFLVRADSPIRTAADLVGRKVGVVAVNGNCDLRLNDDLRRQGIDFRGVRYVDLPIPNMIANLERGGVDAVCLPEPVLSTVDRSRFREVYDPFSGEGAEFPLVSYSVSGSFAAANPNTVAALTRALRRGVQLAHEQPDKVREVLPGFASVSPEVAARMSLPSYPVGTTSAAVQPVAELLVRVGALPGPVRVPAFLDER